VLIVNDVKCFTPIIIPSPNIRGWKNAQKRNKVLC
jgi:hypothetical protein